MRTPGFRKIKGQIALMTGLLILVLVGVVGLAIDSGLGYIIKARLNAAVDAASIAGARGVVIGNTQAAQTANAQAAATNFFNANYANGFMNSTPTLGDIRVNYLGNGQITVDVAATAAVPVNLMGIFGFNMLQVGSAAQTIRRDLDMAFVVDTTGSLRDDARAVRAASRSFLERFNANVDRVALMHFASGGVVDVGFRRPDFGRGFDRETMIRRIDNYQFRGWTNYAEGLWHARDQLNSITNPSGLRVIVFFSDGSPNTISSFYTFRTANRCPQAGAIASDEGSTGTPTGLFSYSLQDELLPGNCGQSYNGNDIWRYVSTTAALPAFYNAHRRTDQEFRFAPNPTTNPSGLRTVTNDNSSRQRLYTNINNASRNIAEEMAWQSRREGIFVFTLGLGANLNQRNGPNNERGDEVLRCMANTADAPARCRIDTQPTGVYAFAANADQLQQAFDKLASQILRLSR
ncbi:hypothetical protein GCM10027046_06120 [Uliginosibacterium flavum]|uniref:VWA domain-containing protein n=1 Tax=Uliginosibacterium flavum TaxID=1396831 RepID=A0ABV2TIS5_9RHOO